ncbi:sulfotransferase [Catenovulum agarivorans]|uniref:sulfotransferase n=1 Tax=Catenovulum agarivorans TaxID=1172192 RepID=UPI0002ED558B|nr:sulfotransferase [Catenovulum agarivorans]
MVNYLNSVNFTIIVSTGRTGTEFLAHALPQIYPCIHAEHEPYPDGFVLGTQYHRENYSNERVIEQYLKMRKPVLERLEQSNKTIYVESNNNLVMFLPALIEFFPRLKVIHVERSPLSYIRSAISNVQQSRYTLFSDTDPRARLNAKDFPDDPEFHTWEEFSQFEKLCWHWKKYNQLIESSIKQPLNYLKISHQKLFESDTLNEFNKFSKFIDPTLATSSDKILSCFSNPRNQVKEYSIGSFEDWGTTKIRAFERIIGPIKDYL